MSRRTARRIILAARSVRSPLRAKGKYPSFRRGFIIDDGTLGPCPDPMIGRARDSLHRRLDGRDDISEHLKLVGVAIPMADVFTS